MRSGDMAMVPPQAFGNADPDSEWVIQNVAVVQAEVYQPPLPKRCVWAMLLLACLFVLRIQQDNYAEAIRWQTFGEPDSGTFPWTARDFAIANDSFEATFFQPGREPLLPGRPPAFLHVPELEPSMVIVGPGNVALSSHSFGGTSFQAPSATAATAAIATDASAGLPGVEALTPVSYIRGLPTCGGGPAGLGGCLVGVQYLHFLPKPASAGPSCHRFVGGTEPPLRPLHDSHGNSSAFCIGARRVTGVAPASFSTAVITWSTRPDSQGSEGSTCIAVLGLLPSIKVAQVLNAKGVTAVLYDNNSSSFVTLGFSTKQLLNIVQYDTLFHPIRRYTLPLSVAWLLRAPRLTGGFLLFVGSEMPFLGMTFTVDLNHAEVYEQDPFTPGSEGQQPVRRRLPKVVEDFKKGQGTAPQLQAGLVAGIAPDRSDADKDRPWGLCELRTCTAGAPETCE